ncbi:bifunctional aminoglycoside phosphotransferase/ATP-binding protein [Herminiimonas sp. CN]|uniref:bifunctional aminoglycoside phosphotransferase/ATP-binding protein n=1 Tax=Herminiimonas sp. CN TaxID=1349818 RepID=UPI000473E6A4|nr:bifunctional aminoglycoside phosphotransferase/ATP-binding protein [Herminiimonas sp. CN]
MPDKQHAALQQQLQLIAALQRQGLELIETHISWILLGGDSAWKIKKALDLGFLDFSTLAKRKFYCEEEIRLNRRLAPEIYLDAMPIGGSIDAPQLGRLPALEYAVRMRRFDVSGQLDALLAAGRLRAEHIDRLAALLAHFHASLPAADPGSGFGSADAILAVSRQNFEQLDALCSNAGERRALLHLRQATDAEFAACRPLFEQRRSAGFVRECHGDLHLGNIVLIDDRPVPFDCLEFNPGLRWIDVINELAFPMMDLIHRQHSGLAFRLLNAYLEISGDYAGVALLRFYLAGRATVRAKVSAIRIKQCSTQPGLAPAAASNAQADARSHLDLAGTLLRTRRPALVISHGLPGSGKSTLALEILERRQAVRLRSDVERKRLFGLAALDRSSSGQDMYGAAATRRTYAHLQRTAHQLLAAGWSVIVDAAFLRREERDVFRQLAQQMAVPFAIASTRADAEILRNRIRQRSALGSDPSEADIAVLEKLASIQQPLSPAELTRSAVFESRAGSSGFADLTGSWDRLDRLLTAA